MNIIGSKFRNNEIFIPEVLISARAMNQSIALLKPLLESSGVKAVGKVCIGTVQGDLHDIGKNLVKLMLESKGLKDMGTVLCLTCRLFFIPAFFQNPFDYTF